MNTLSGRISSRPPVHRGLAARLGALLVVIAMAFTPITGTAQQQELGRDPQKDPQKARVAKPSAPEASRVLAPNEPRAPELAKVIADLRVRTLMELSFTRAPMGGIAKILGEKTGIQISVSKRSAKQETTLHARGELTPIEILVQLTRASDTYAVLEPSGVVRLLSKSEFASLAKASGGRLGSPLPMPSYHPQLEIRLLAHADKGGLVVDLAAEKKRLEAWLSIADNRRMVLEQPQRVAEFMDLPPERGGRLCRDFQWLSRRVTTAPNTNRFDYSSTYGPSSKSALLLYTSKRHADGPRSKKDYLVELLAVDMKTRGFTTGDLVLDELRKTKDAVGRPALLYRLKPDPAAAYADLTGKNVRRGMAIILDGHVICLPVIMSRIGAHGQISGFSKTEIARFLAAFKN